MGVSLPVLSYRGTGRRILPDWFHILQKAKSVRQVALLLFPDFSNLCLANAVEPLRAANTLAKRKLYAWRYLGLGTDILMSSSGLPVQPEAALSEAGRGDYLFVMPSYGFRAQATPDCARALRAASRRFGTLVGLDTGSWLMAAAGLLDGRRATSHWDILDALAERFPEVTVSEERFVIDGDRASCGGATTTLDLMLELVERHHGPTLALEVAALFMLGDRERRGRQVHLPPHRTIRAAAALMRRHVEAPLPIGAVAARLGIGQRALEQVFRKRTGRTPAQIYRSIRLAEARRWVEDSDAGVPEIAERCGYRDATAMTRAFKAEYGVPPSGLRRGRG